MQKQPFCLQQIESPVGKLNLYAKGKRLIGLTFANRPETLPSQLKGIAFISQESPVIKKAAQQLEEYFCGKRKFFDLNLSLTGTVFQKKAWSTLRKIPYGQTLSYQEQAAKAGSKKAVRAIGSANGQNPIAIVVPCHRVIASNGRLSGYTGGPKKKAALLRLEKVVCG